MAGGLLSGVVVAATAISAFAHHPGSHAWRQSDGRVKLESVVTVPDGCTFIGTVTPGAPAGQAMPPEAFPVTVRLRRSDAAAMCTMALKVLKDESVLTVPAAQKRLHLYVVGASGQITTTERVPIR